MTSHTFYLIYMEEKSIPQVALAVRGFAVHGFDYSRQIYAEPNPWFML